MLFDVYTGMMQAHLRLNPYLEGKQANLWPIAMRDAQRHMQVLHQLLQGCGGLPGMPYLHFRQP